MWLLIQCDICAWQRRYWFPNWYIDKRIGVLELYTRIGYCPSCDKGGEVYIRDIGELKKDLSNSDGKNGVCTPSRNR